MRTEPPRWTGRYNQCGFVAEKTVTQPALRTLRGALQRVGEPLSIDIIEITDRGYRRRLLVAAAAAFALHEVIAGVWPRQERAAPQERVVAEVVTISRRTPAPTAPPTPKPTPPPTPVPTPRVTPMPHYTIAPKIVVRAPAPKAAARPAKRRGGAAAHKHVVRATPPPIPIVAARKPVRSLANGTAAGQQSGGSGTGAGAGAGTGGLGGTGSGNGTSGTSNGGDVSTAPCGDVFLLPGHLSYRRDGTVVQEMLAKIVTRDGTVTIGRFPWPFIYPSEAQNPFVHDEALGSRDGVPVQPPPPGTDIASLPPVIQVVLKHTDPTSGTTTFPRCTES